MSILITRPPALYGVFHTKEWIKRVGRFVKAMQYAVYVLYLINRGQCEDELCPAERLTETCFFLKSRLLCKKFTGQSILMCVHIHFAQICLNFHEPKVNFQ